jgi:hypothetical protein
MKKLYFKILFHCVFLMGLSLGSLQAQVFITEIADPNNAADARYVELYNAGDSDVDLSTGWFLQRYTNDNAEPQDSILLTGTIAAKGFYIICANNTTFNSTFGFDADEDIGTGGPADSNGDDNIQLGDNNKNIVDIFGVPGEDGSGTAHEFEDGRAERVDTVTVGKATWNAVEWNIDNDGGAGDGAIDAPDGFDPGAWIGATASDTDAPLATWEPLTGAVNVPVVSDVVITFNEPIENTDASEITDANVASLITFKLTDAAGADVAFSASIDATKQIITIEPDANLAYSQLYYVAIGAVQDAADNETVTESITFTTGDASAKYLILGTPAGGEKYYAGEEVTFNWESANITNVDISVYIPENDAWEAVLSNIDSDGTEVFTIPADAEYGTTYRAAITDVSDVTITDTSDVFTIIATPTINEIQSSTTDGDASTFEGSIVRTSGVVVFSDGSDEYYLADSAGANNGILVFDAANIGGLSVGDSVVIEAEVDENFDLTQLENVVSISVEASGKPVVATRIETGDYDETYESVLLQFVNVEVTNDDLGFGEFEVNDGSGALAIDDRFYLHSAVMGENITVTAIGNYSFGAYKVLPRSSSDIVSASDTVVSGVYTVDNEKDTISDIPFSHDLATFKSNITPSDSASWNVYDDDSTTLAVELNSTKILIVTAADGITMRYYGLDVMAFVSDDATVSSTAYTVDDVEETITGIPFETDLATFESNLTPAAGATFETYESDGTTIATDLQTGYIVIGTAEDGTTTKSYTITIDDPDSNPTLTSTRYNVDLTEATVTGIPFGTTLETFEATLGTGPGGSFETYEADGTTIATDLQTGYIVIVTAQDGTTTKSYTITIDAELLDLFFTEYVEGSSNNKALEIYNPNNVEVSLNNYIMLGTGNEASDWEYNYPFLADEVIAANDVYVIVDDQAIDDMKNVADWIADDFEVGFNGNDSRGLAKLLNNDTIVVDVIGDPNNPTGDYYSVAGIANGMQEHTLLRKHTVTTGNTNWTASAGTNESNSEWIVLDQNDISNLGSVTTPPALSDNADLNFIKVDGENIPDFNPAVLNYTHTLPAGTTEVPTVTWEVAQQDALVTPTVATAVPGTTSLLVTAQDGTTTKTYTVEFVLSTGVQSSALANITVYPSPANAEVNIVNVEQVERIQIINITGNVVYDQPVLGANKVHINVSDWASGIYIIRAIDKNNSSTKRFIVE